MSWPGGPRRLHRRVQQEAARVARHVGVEASVCPFLACGPPSFPSACVTPPFSRLFASKPWIKPRVSYLLLKNLRRIFLVKTFQLPPSVKFTFPTADNGKFWLEDIGLFVFLISLIKSPVFMWRMRGHGRVNEEERPGEEKAASEVTWRICVSNWLGGDLVV